MEQQKGILFIDIETVPVVPDYHLLSEQMQAEWTRKSKFIKTSNEEIVGPAMIFGDKAGIFSEFAQIYIYSLSPAKTSSDISRITKIDSTHVEKKQLKFHVVVELFLFLRNFIFVRTFPQ